MYNASETPLLLQRIRVGVRTQSQDLGMPISLKRSGSHQRECGGYVRGYRNSYVFPPPYEKHWFVLLQVIRSRGFTWQTAIFYIDTVDPVWRVCYWHVTGTARFDCIYYTGCRWRDSISGYDALGEKSDSSIYLRGYAELTQGGHF